MIPSSWIDGAPVTTSGGRHGVINPATGDRSPRWRSPPLPTSTSRWRRPEPRCPAGRRPPGRAVCRPVQARRTPRGPRREVIAEEVSQTGKPVRLATEFDVPGSIDNIAFFAGAARHLEGKATAGVPPTTPPRSGGRPSAWSPPSPRGTTPRRWRCGSHPRPRGGMRSGDQAGRITRSRRSPWLGWPVRRPAGRVLNVVTGAGADVGTTRWPGHRDVDVVTFTGSTAVGRKVMAAAAIHGHRTNSNSGGKAPSWCSTMPTSTPRFTARWPAPDQHRSGPYRRHPRDRGRRPLRRFHLGRGRTDGRCWSWAIRRPPTPTSGHDHDGAPQQGRRDGRPRPGGGCASGHRRQGAGSARLLLPATLLADVAEIPGLPRRDLRPGADGARATTATTTPCARPTTPTYGLAASAWTRDVYRAQRASREIKPAACGSTTTSRSSARCRTAGRCVGLRQGHVGLLLRGVSHHQACDQ